MACIGSHPKANLRQTLADSIKFLKHYYNSLKRLNHELVNSPIGDIQMLKKIETFYSRDTDRSLTSDCLIVAKMTAGSIHDKGTEDAGLVEPMLEVFVVRADDSDVIPPASRDYALDAIRESFQGRPTDCISWVVAGHAIPEQVMVEILDWTYTTEWRWLSPDDV